MPPAVNECQLFQLLQKISTQLDRVERQQEVARHERRQILLALRVLPGDHEEVKEVGNVRQIDVQQK